MTAERKHKGRKRNPNAAPSPRNLQRQERHIRAVELRKEGLPFDEIARRVGYANASGAYKAVEAIKDAARQSAGEELIAREADTLEEAMARVRGVLLGADDGDLVVKAAHAIARLSESRRKLFGLDAPSRTDVTMDGSVLQVVFNPALAPRTIDSPSFTSSDLESEGQSS
ncbi:hypothetical protein [Nakamurella lactea]|uniref:hypothetical protein n=1 Tax=Nakamurella lactea TaxID=459515 RepID=UPI000412C8F6|nr:hypothetical protein [Nakamurella lactea]